MIHFILPASGSFTLTDYFTKDRPEVAARFRVLHFEDLPARTHFERGTYVIAGLDQVSPAMMRLVIQLHEQLARAPGIRVLNHPARTIGRFQLLDELHRLGRNEFRAVRPDDDYERLRYPVFLRSEQSHDGNLSQLLDTPRQVKEAVGRALVQGHVFADLMVIEFCSTIDAAGLYRKYAAFKVGDRILARSMNAGRDWMLKLENSEFTRPLVLEDREYVMQNLHTAELAEIFEIARVDYGQIDYAFKDGRMQVWEINVNPTIGRGVPPEGGIGPREFFPIRDETREYFFDRFREAWAAIDDQPPGPPITVSLDQHLRDAAAQRPFRATRVLEIARAIARPVKPALQPITTPLLRGLAAVKRALRRG